MKVGLAQINSTVGDIGGNAQLILDSVSEAADNQCDLLIFPELILTGYPPEDLLLKASFVEDNLTALKTIARKMGKQAAIVGFVDQVKGQRFNAAAWIQNGKVLGVYHKRLLPNYGVFDENRYFTPGEKFYAPLLKGVRLGITICEDIWAGTAALAPLKKLKPDLVVNISASPFHVQKLRERHEIAKKAARYLAAPLVYCNLLGGQDELVFDGGSFVTNAKGKVMIQNPLFREGLFCFDFGRSGPILPARQTKPPTLAPLEEIFNALLLGLRDYVRKNNFTQVTLGLSGGIDSALVAALAVEALGSDHVIGVSMPSKYNKIETQNDALEVAKNLGIRLIEIPIQNVFEEFLKVLKPTFADAHPNIAEENLQARIRGNLLMALSNKFNWLVLTTGNKSETSTGYCTLYGDTAGGFAILKDVLKTTVYDLARLINKKTKKDVIPKSILSRPPTAELRENQKDEDTLGPYSELDPIIVGYVEKNLSIEQLSKKTPRQSAHIWKVLSLIDHSEYKRRQAPPGIKITPRAFGRDHRMPITNRYSPTKP